MSEDKIQTAVKMVGKVINVDMKNEKFPKVTLEEQNSDSQYPTVLTFDLNTEKVRTLPQMGDMVEASGYVGSREWHGRYFTGVRCSFCKVLGNSHKPQQPKPQQENIFEEDVNF